MSLTTGANATESNLAIFFPTAHVPYPYPVLCGQFALFWSSDILLAFALYPVILAMAKMTRQPACNPHRRRFATDRALDIANGLRASLGDKRVLNRSNTAPGYYTLARSILLLHGAYCPFVCLTKSAILVEIPFSNSSTTRVTTVNNSTSNPTMMIPVYASASHKHHVANVHLLAQKHDDHRPSRRSSDRCSENGGTPLNSGRHRCADLPSRCH